MFKYVCSCVEGKGFGNRAVAGKSYMTQSKHEILCSQIERIKRAMRIKWSKLA